MSRYLLIPIGEGGSTSATAPGAALNAASSVAAGGASGSSGVVALGAMLNGASSLSPGAATGRSIVITSPTANAFFRRGNNSTVSIPVTVSYTGSPTYIEARFNGGAWQQFTPSGSPFTFSITGCYRGYGAIDVRFSNDVGTATSVTPVAVGKAIAMLGQSNSSGRGTNNQAAPAAGAYLFDNAYTFRPLADPYDGLPYGGTQLRSALNDSSSAAGSYVPRLAQRYIDAGEPTLWIPANMGGTSISSWARNLSTTSLYGAAKDRIDAAGGADLIIWHQGETDAQSGVSQATYQSALAQLVSDLRSDLGNPVVAIQILHIQSGYTAGYNAIRAAQMAVADSASGAMRGGDLAGITINLHFTTNAELTSVADTTFSALNGVPATASGASLTGLTSIYPGSATGQKNSSAPGVALVSSTTLSAGSALGGSGGSFSGSLSEEDVQRIAAAVIAALNATTGPRTLGQHLQIQTAVLAGSETGAGTGHITFTDGAATVEADVPLPGQTGNRSNVTVSGV